MFPVETLFAMEQPNLLAPQGINSVARETTVDSTVGCHRTQLINRGANIKHQTNDGWSALHIATKNNHLDLVSLFIQQGANIQQQKERNGWTALLIATEFNHVDLAVWLLDHSSNVDRCVGLFVTQSWCKH
jgi:ankyrin repeat protein